MPRMTVSANHARAVKDASRFFIAIVLSARINTTPISMYLTKSIIRSVRNDRDYVQKQGLECIAFVSWADMQILCRYM